MTRRKDDLSWLGTVMDLIYIRLIDLHAGRPSSAGEDFILIDSTSGSCHRSADTAAH